MVLSKRNNFIDLLRIVAAVSVVLYHFYLEGAYRVDNLYTNLCYTYGRLGVPMFFVISGYCIMIASNHAKNPSQFIIRRFFRIFPPYWFSLIITLTVILIVTLARGVNSYAVLPKTIPDILSTFFLLTHPVTKIMPVNGVYWTLPLELMFYIAIFLCSFFKRNVFTLLLIALTLATFIVPIVGHGFLVFFIYWPLFSVGAALFKLLHDDKSRQALNVILFIVSVAAFYPSRLELNYCVTCGTTVLLIAIFHFKPLKNNKISQLGDVSYSLYLIHVPLLIYTFNGYRDIPPLKKNSVLNPLLDVVLLIIILYLSKLMYRYVEVPAISLGKRLSSKKGGSAAIQ